MENVFQIDLKSKVILITGGYGHLGSGIVRSLIAHGAIIYVLGRVEEKFKVRFVDLLPEGNLYFEFCDVSKTENINTAIDSVFEKHGRIDAVINNAAYSRGKLPETMTDDDFAMGLEGTLLVGYKIIRKLIPIMKGQGFGKIINVSSMYGMVAPDFGVYDASPDFLNPPHYGAAKAGLIQLTKYYASYLGKYNIQVNAVSPGPFPSPKVQNDVGFIERLADKTALKRIGKPADLGGVFVFLSSDAANYITGQNIAVDGGWTTS